MTDPNHSTEEPTIIASYAMAIAETFEHLGLDSTSLLGQCDFPSQIRVDPYLRISSKKFYDLFEKAMDLSHNPYLGLEVGKRLKPTVLHALGYSLTASITLRDFLERLARYYQVVSNNALARIEETEDALTLSMEIVVQDPTYQTHLTQVSFLVNFMRLLHHKDFAPTMVCFTHQAPKQGIAPYQQFFRCPIEFGCGQLKIVIPLKEVEFPLSGGSRDLAMLNESIVQEYIASKEKGDIIARVNKILMDEMSSGRVSKTIIAEKMHMSERTLHNHLSEQGTHFQEVLDNIRSKLALGYLEKKSMTMSEISFLLGFSDTSVFSRSFKRWFGVSPSEYKAREGLI